MNRRFKTFTFYVWGKKLQTCEGRDIWDAYQRMSRKFPDRIVRTPHKPGNTSSYLKAYKHNYSRASRKIEGTDRRTIKMLSKSKYGWASVRYGRFNPD